MLFYLLGGQTALNLCLEADEKNLARFWVRMIGDVNAINMENREQFKQLLKKLVPSAPAEICTSLR
jgi:carbamoyl-phosphate synthase large subunit